MSSFSFCFGKVLLWIALHHPSRKLGPAVLSPASRLCSDRSSIVLVPASISGESLRPKDIQRLTVHPSRPPLLSANTVSFYCFHSDHPSPCLIKGLPLEAVKAGPAQSGIVPQSVPLFQGQLVPTVPLKIGNTPTGEVTWNSKYLSKKEKQNPLQQLCDLGLQDALLQNPVSTSAKGDSGLGVFIFCRLMECFGNLMEATDFLLRIVLSCR